MTDFKGCSDDETKFKYVAKGADEIAKKYIDVEMDYNDVFDEKTNQMNLPKDKFPQYVRKMRQENEQAIQKGEQAPHYIWQDDLKQRISLAMSEATSRDDFADKLNDRGVVIEKNGKSKKYGEYFTYVMTDTSNFASEKDIPKRGMRVRSYKLGKDYMPETLDEMLAEKQVDIPEPNVSYAAPAPTEEEIAEKEKQEENANEFAEWAYQNDYDYMDSDGSIDLDAYEKALKAYEARNDEVPEEVIAELSDADLVVSEPVINQPVKAPDVPQKAPEAASKKQSYQQQLIKKIQNDVASMDARLDDIPDDEDYFGS